MGKPAKKGAETGQTPTPRARTPQQLARQERAFAMSVLGGQSVRDIAAALGIDKDTAAADIRHEEQRRADELGVRRENEKARSVAFYESVADLALKRAAVSDEILVQIRDGTECEKKVSDRSYGDAIKARERIDKILGVDAPTRVDLGLQQLLDALD